ncbi:MAG: beta-galactosidase trimerization domain-containing protein [Anaerolineae bacterium]
MSYWWDDRPWRMIQTNLREIDMLDIDAGRFVADLQSFKATNVLFNCAGIIASYPTDLAFQFQSPFLKGDSLERIIEVCHAADIKLLARTDFSKIRRPIYEQHPDWAYRTTAGDIVDYNGDVHACLMGDYQQKFAFEIIDELLTRYAVDGIFFNMGGFQTRDYSGNNYGICHCDACRRGFGEAYGLALPAREDMFDPVYRKYRLFTAREVKALNTRVHDLIHRIRPDIAIDRDYGRRSGFIRQEANTAVDRALPHWQYQASSNTRWAVGTYPELISTSTTVDFIDFPYRHVTVSPQQQKLRLAQSLANGGQLDWYLMGRLDNHADRSGYEPIREVFQYHAAHEDEYRHNQPLADVLLLNDTRCGDAEARGWYRMLSENHFLFDAPLLETALERDWSGYKAIVLPDVRYLSDALAQKLDNFVTLGGALISVHQSGFYDDSYEQRPAPALASLGIERLEQGRTDTRSSYFELHDGDRPALPSLADTDLVYLDGAYLYCAYEQGVERRLRLVPPHMFGPPERCYYDTVVDRPAYTVRAVGRGQAIHVPWLPGSLFHRQGYVNTAWFMADLLEHVAGIAPLGGNLSEQVEVTRMRNRAGYDLVHLVNISGHFGVSFYQPVTMHDLEVELPCSSAPIGAASLVTGESITIAYADGVATLMIPRLEMFEAIKVEW